MTKKSLLIAAAAIAAAAVLQASGQGQGGVDTSAVSTTLNDRKDTPDDRKAPRADTLIHTSADTLIDTSVNTSANASANTQTNAYDTHIDTLITTTISTYNDTLISQYPGGFADTQINTYANTSATDTPAGAEANAQSDTSVNTPPADKSVKRAADDPQKIFLLPSYTFHIIFFAVSAAVIAATLYFFMTRRNDSRRFLTTTRLSVLDKLVQRACRYIEVNYPDPALTPEAVCNTLVTGKAYLDALFMNELGINVKDFIVQVRVNAIKHHLSTPSSQTQQQTPDIDAICADCGFADRSEAERCFSVVSGGVGIAEFVRFSKMQNQRKG
jgi:AraC-like DNA-binding protein